MHLCLNLSTAVCTPTISTVTVTWPGWPSGSDRGLQLVCSPSVRVLLSSEDSMWQKCRNMNSAAQVRLVELQTLNFRREVLHKTSLLCSLFSHLHVCKVFSQHLKKEPFCCTVHIVFSFMPKTACPCAVDIPLRPLPLCLCVNVFTWQPADSPAAPGNPTALLWAFHVSPAFRS